MGADLNILVVDDTVTYRKLLSQLVSEIENVDLAGIASNGKIALSKIKISPPDLVLLDMYMPVMNGLETLSNIKKDYPNVEVIMLSAYDKGNANLTVQALEHGAIDFIAKPSGGSIDENISELRSALFPLISLVRTKKYSRQARMLSGIDKQKPSLRPAPKLKKIPIKPKSYIKQDVKSLTRAIPKTPPQTTIIPPVTRRPGLIDVVGLGVSTGGPNALLKVIPLITKNFPVPILAVQHMPPMFTASLAQRLDKLSNITVVEGQDGQSIERGCMYIAPGGHHMIVKKKGTNKILNLIDSPPVNSCRPAVDVLFSSIAITYGGKVLTVVLTGMGNDGATGVSLIREKGGYSIVQDEDSSVVWGMPGAVVRANSADEVIVLDEIAGRVEDIVYKSKK
ncbi:Protein-glutamate methylesterase/protein-glutamine glutaminase [Candidatus Magnetomoraceae bacterium gMMP-15]